MSSFVNFVVSKVHVRVTEDKLLIILLPGGFLKGQLHNNKTDFTGPS